MTIRSLRDRFRGLLFRRNRGLALDRRMRAPPVMGRDQPSLSAQVLERLLPEVAVAAIIPAAL